jgi:hypothetical protein
MEEVRERIATAVDPSPEEPIRSVEEVLRMLIVDARSGSPPLPLALQPGLGRDRAGSHRERLFEASRAFYRSASATRGLIEAGARAGGSAPISIPPR